MSLQSILAFLLDIASLFSVTNRALFSDEPAARNTTKDVGHTLR